MYKKSQQSGENSGPIVISVLINYNHHGYKMINIMASTIQKHIH